MVVVTDRDLPELATNETWRGIMRRARLTPREPDYPTGMTQKQLADLVDTSQVMISMIESGEVGSSKFILPICKALDIVVPEHFTDEVDRAWVELGRVIRAKRGLDKQKQLSRTVIELLGLTDEELREAGLLEERDDDIAKAHSKPRRPK